MTVCKACGLDWPLEERDGVWWHEVDESDLSALTTLTESVLEAARTIGNVTPADIIKFADGVIAAKAAEPDA